MISKSPRPFFIHHNYIIHAKTGDKLPYLRIIAKIANPRSVAVVIDFDNALSERRREELSWPEYSSWTKFNNKLMEYGYRCNNVNLLKSLHDWYKKLNIPVIFYSLPAGGWWRQRKVGGKLYYVRTNIIKRCSKTSGCLHKGSYAPFQYGLDALDSDIARRDTEIAAACGRSPALTVATLSALAATLLPALEHLPSFGFFYGADSASDREVIRCAAASVFGAPHNFSILGKSPTPLQLVADFRHGVVCSDIPDHATEKQILSFYQPLLGISDEISSVSLPSDMRLLALATGPHSQLGRVPRSISVSAMVDPETGLYDSLPDSCSPEQMNARIITHARRHKGGLGRKFVELIEQNQSRPFQLRVTRLINEFVKQLQPKTKDERSRALAVALLRAAGHLGIEWRLLSWKVERLEGVLKELFAASCKSLPDLAPLEEVAIGKLRQHLREANKLTLSRRGHKLEYTDQQVREADVYLEGNYVYVRPALLSQWLPGQEGEIVINYLSKRFLFEKNLSGRATKKVQKTILGKRESFYGINISYLGEGFPANPEVVEAGGGGDEVTVAATEPTGLGERLLREYDQPKAADQPQMANSGIAPVDGGKKVGE